MEPIKILKRECIGMGKNQPAFDKMEDFYGRGLYNPLLMHSYGMNIYEKGKAVGYLLKVRITGYRGLPINMIQELAFEVDGEWISDDVKYIWYKDKDFPLSLVGTGHFDNEFMWDFHDYLPVFIKKPGGIPQGVHKVRYGLALRDHYSSTCYCEKDVTIV